MGVFPFWPDSFLKKHVICIRHYFFNRIDVMKHPPEVFDRVKTVNLMKDVFVMTSSFTLLFFLVVTESVNVPKSPSKRKINIINTTFSLKKHWLTHHEFHFFLWFDLLLLSVQKLVMEVRLTLHLYHLYRPFYPKLN